MSSHSNLPPASVPVGVCAFTIFLPTLALVLRAISRRIGRVHFWWDDWFVLGAWGFSIILSVTFLVGATDHGFGHHGGDVGFFHHILYFGEIEYNFSIGLSKLSVLCFYYRIFEHNASFTRQLRIAAAFVLTWMLTFTLASILQCIPIESFWDPSIEGRCVSQFGFFLGQAIPNILLDFWLLILPVRPLWRLNIKKGQRVILVLVFILGYLNPVISILRIVSFIQLGNNTGIDQNWNFVSPAMWSGAEPAISIFSCSIPSYTHLYRRVLKFLRPKNTLGSSGVQPRNYTPPKKRSRRLWGLATVDLIGSSEDQTKLTGRGTQQITNCESVEAAQAGDGNEPIPLNEIRVRREIEVSYQEPGQPV